MPALDKGAARRVKAAVERLAETGAGKSRASTRPGVIIYLTHG